VNVIARTADGIPYAQPEIVLLFKAKAARQKDDDDFARVLPFLDAPRHSWLRDPSSSSIPNTVGSRR
jgi:hypothetical protein